MTDLASARALFEPRYRTALAEALASTEEPRPLVLVRAAGGLGKTRLTTDLLRHLKVVWFSPKNADQRQLEVFLDEPLPGLTPLPGPGGFRPTVEKRIALEDPGACLEPRRLLRIQGRGLARFTAGLACAPCPSRSVCLYRNWAPTKDWLFASHARLVLETDDQHLFKGRDLVVIDESPLSTILSAVTFAAGEITEAADALRTAHVRRTEPNVAADAFTELFDVASDLLRAPPPNRRAVPLRLLLQDLGYRFIRRVMSMKSIVLDTTGRVQSKDKKLRTVDPLAVRDFLNETKGFPRKLIEKLEMLADAIADDEQARPATVLVVSGAVGLTGIAAGHFKVAPIPKCLPIVMLDATADPLLVSLAFSRAVVVVDVDVDQPNVIHQTVDYRYPAATLLDPSGTAIARLMRIVDKYKADNLSHRVGLILKKSVFEDLNVRTRVTQSVPAADVHHFWSLRGSNDLEHFDALFVVGAPELRPLDAEAHVRAFMTRIPPDPQETPCSFVAESTPIGSAGAWGVVDRHGDEVELEERGYGFRFESLVYRLFHQDEYVQALLRIRPFDPSKKKNIFFMSNTFLGVFDVTLVSEDELLGQDPLVRACEILDCAPKPLSMKALARELGVDRSTLHRQGKKRPTFYRSIAKRLR